MGRVLSANIKSKDTHEDRFETVFNTVVNSSQS